MAQLFAVILDYLLANPFDIACYLVVAASIVCAGTKTPPPDSALGRLYRLLECCALNCGRAKDRGDEPDPPGAGSGPGGGLALALVVLPLLGACGLTAEGDRLRGLAADAAARTADATLDTAIVYQCELARIGALKRRFGAAPETAAAYARLCQGSDGAATMLLAVPTE